MTSQLTAIWDCRYFWLSLVRLDLRRRYRRTLLGLGWSLLQPIAMTLILCVAFQSIFRADLRSFAPFLLTGLAYWNYVVTVSIQGCQCFIEGEPYLRQFPVPLAIFPLRTALGSAVHFLAALAVVLVLVALTLGFGNPWVLITIVPAVVLLFCMGWALATLMGIATVLYDDVQHLGQLGFQALFYLTPILYPPETLSNQPALATIIALNPLVPLLNILRDPIVFGQVSSSETYAFALATVFLTVGMACLALRRMQGRLIFHL
jgi:ABC-type polysaccharide/polyol phosphate export permease